MTHLTRRHLLGLFTLTVAAGAAAGCRAPWEDEPSPDPSATKAARSADSALLARAVAEVEAVQSRLGAAVARGRAPRGSIRLGRLHTAHLIELQAMESASSKASAPAPAPASASAPASTAADTDVATLESQHLLMLQLLAGQARSGALARVLASMAAAVAQHLEELGLLEEPARSLSAPPVTASDKASLSTVAALQEALAGEHAAMFVLGVLAARTFDDGPLDRALDESWRNHRELRDQLEGWLRAAGKEPVAAAADYQLPNRLDTPAQVRRAALQVQRRTTDLWATVVGRSAVGEVRTWAVVGTNESAVRELVFGGKPENFPGAVQLTDR